MRVVMLPVDGSCPTIRATDARYRDREDPWGHLVSLEGSNNNPIAS